MNKETNWVKSWVPELERRLRMTTLLYKLAAKERECHATD